MFEVLILWNILVTLLLTLIHLNWEMFGIITKIISYFLFLTRSIRLLTACVQFD